ncbi:MAG: hypothetical protein ABEJ06_04910 [Haloarculaceae archaeon]
MALDVEVPDPPSLRAPQQRGAYEAIDMTDQEPEDDYRHEELETFLREGAWQDAFEQWAEETYLTASEFETLRERELFDRFDFYWDPAADEVGYRAPTLAAEGEPAFDDPNGVEAELDTLGRIVSEVLENDYLLRDEETFGFFTEEYTGETDETE